MKQEYTYLDQEIVINKPYVTIRDIMVLLPVSETKARQILHDIRHQMEENDEYCFYSKPAVIPLTKLVKNGLVDVNNIRKQADLMRKAGYGV